MNTEDLKQFVFTTSQSQSTQQNCIRKGQFPMYNATSLQHTGQYCVSIPHGKIIHGWPPLHQILWISFSRY